MAELPVDSVPTNGSLPAADPGLSIQGILFRQKVFDTEIKHPVSVMPWDDTVPYGGRFSEKISDPARKKGLPVSFNLLSYI